MTLTCEKCGIEADIDRWTNRPVSGPLPRNTYQCPGCGFAFEKKHGPAKVFPNGFVMPGPVRLIQVEARL